MTNWSPPFVLFPRFYPDLQHLLRCVVTLDGVGLNDHGRVGFLPVLGLGGDRSGVVALTQSEGGSQCRQHRNEHGDDDLKKPETFLNPAEIFVCDFIPRNYSYLKNDKK